MPTVAVLGASRNRSKYGNKSVRAHARAGWEVFPINPQVSEIEGFRAFRSLREVPVRSLDRVTVYLPPEIGITLLGDIVASQPREVWLNPGSESEELLSAAQKFGLPVICACSIVDVGLSPAKLS
ncbi:MAG: CoA-binding protein [Planctomycetes bacterium]|nr:CoA-binding protein [Planctomycetota bacterium]